MNAVEKARRRVLSDPSSAQAWGELGMIFAAHGYEAEADACFAEAERLDPTEPRWPYYRSLFASVHQPEKAIAPLRRAVTADNGKQSAETMAAVRLRLAEALVDQQQLDEAEAIFRQELARSPGDPRARFGLAQIALIRGDRRTAREGFAALVNDTYARKRAASQCAALARADGDLDAARQFEELARQTSPDPSWPDPYLHELRLREIGQQGLLKEVEALEAAGRLNDATQLLLKLVEVDPKPRLLVTAGIYLAKMKDYTRAEAKLRECLKTEPNNAQANYFLCVVLLERAEMVVHDRREESLALLREAVKAGRAAVAVKPDHGLAWLYLGRSLLGIEENTAAVEAMRQAVACRPEIVETHLYLSEAMAASGDKPNAIRAAQDAEKLAKPGDPRPRQLLERLQQPVTPKK